MDRKAAKFHHLRQEKKYFLKERLIVLKMNSINCEILVYNKLVKNLNFLLSTAKKIYFFFVFNFCNLIRFVTRQEFSFFLASQGNTKFKAPN